MKELNTPRELARFKRRFLGVALLAALITLIAGCHAESSPGTASEGTPTPPSASGPAAAVQTTVYHGKGLVKSINSQRPSIEVDHEDIPGLMPAMTMEFYVKDKTLLQGLKADERIEFTIENGVGGLKITEIKKI